MIIKNLITPTLKYYLLKTATYQFNMFRNLKGNFTQEGRMKQGQESFKKQMNTLATTDVFNLQKFKERISDQLNQMNSIKNKFSSENQQNKRELQAQLKVMNCLFEDQIFNDELITDLIKKDIATVSQLQFKQVKKVFTYYQQYKNMHKILRDLHLKGQPLPQSQEELEELYMESGLGQKSEKYKRMHYKQYNKRQITKQLLKRKNYGHFFD